MDDIHVTVFVILLVLGGKETQLCVVEIVTGRNRRHPGEGSFCCQVNELL